MSSSLQEVLDELFDPEELKRIRDDHDSEDGLIQVFRYSEGCLVYHPGHVRGPILGKGQTVEAAAQDFLRNYRGRRESQVDEDLLSTATEIGKCQFYSGENGYWTVKKVVNIEGAGINVFPQMFQTDRELYLRLW